MSFLARIEGACSAFVERVFAATFPGEVQPAEVARKMAAVLEAYALGERERRGPRLFLVRVSTRDFERLAPRRAELTEHWRTLAKEAAEALGAPLREPPEVRLIADPAAPPGTVDVDLDDSGAAAVLVVRRGLPAGGRLPLDRGGTIGRDASCDLVLNDPRVSRRHACAQRAGSAWEIVDLHSRNGTIVDGCRVERAPLRPGSLVELGDTLLAVEEAPSGS
ncbi:DUF2662 domain-containing protein [bacterium]|nr:MAG: DUF2662 domain-containing protein [bacterium]